MRFRARTDRNHSEIVEAFRLCGCSVLSLAAIGKGVHDLLVSAPGWNVLVEVKTENGKLTPDQVSFHAAWKGPQAIIRTAGEAFRLVECMRAGKGSEGR